MRLVSRVRCLGIFLSLLAVVILVVMLLAVLIVHQLPRELFDALPAGIAGNPYPAGSAEAAAWLKGWRETNEFRVQKFLAENPSQKSRA